MISNTIVEVLNRTDRTLIAVKDGQEYQIPPGRSHLRADVIPFAKNQNAVPGTDDGHLFESLISVIAKNPVDQRDPLDEIPSEILKLLAPERINRSSLPLDRQKNVRKVDFAELRRAQISPNDVTEGMVDGSHLGRD